MACQMETDRHLIVGGKVVWVLRQAHKKIMDLFVHDGSIALCGFVIEMLLAYSPAQTPILSIGH